MGRRIDVGEPYVPPTVSPHAPGRKYRNAERMQVQSRVGLLLAADPISSLRRYPRRGRLLAMILCSSPPRRRRMQTAVICVILARGQRYITPIWQLSPPNSAIALSNPLRAHGVEWAGE